MTTIELADTAEKLAGLLLAPNLLKELLHIVKKRLRLLKSSKVSPLRRSAVSYARRVKKRTRSSPCRARGKRPSCR